MIDFIQNFLGQVPEVSSIYDMPALTEWIFGAAFLFLVVTSIYAIFGNLISFFRR